MPHRTSTTLCVVRLIPLHRLTARQARICEAVRREGGRCWAAMVAAHHQGREQGIWIAERDLERDFANKFKLHSQTIQAFAQKLDANLQTAKELRQQGQNIEYPYKTPDYQTVPWKDMAIRVIAGAIWLSNGRGNEPLVLDLPAEYHDANIRKVELTWRADH